MNIEQSYKVLEQALNIACSKGCYNLQDASAIFTSLKNIEYISKYEFVNYGTGLITKDIYSKITEPQSKEDIKEPLNDK